MLRSDLCDYSNIYIVVKERITVEGDNNAKKEIETLPLRIMLHFVHA